MSERHDCWMIPGRRRTKISSLFLHVQVLRFLEADLE